MIAVEPRLIGTVNWVGLWTLYRKEVLRFLKVPWQTIVAPLVGGLLFLAVFALAFSDRARVMGDLPYLEFLAPGLIMMAVVQNSFANTSSSLMIAKIQGNIVDVLMPPLSAWELTLAYAAGGATRGMLVAVVVGLAMAPFVSLTVVNPWALAFFCLAAALMLSLAGIAAGIWADKFDHMASVTNFLVTPLSFLSGTFYSIRQLPDFWYWLSHFDPIFYAIDGFRAGFIGTSDTSLLLGAAALVGTNAALWVLCHRMFARGYKLKV
jgi:ABC-2 type transport system permease protein